jgi:signal transduction histidine kinase
MSEPAGDAASVPGNDDRSRRSSLAGTIERRLGDIEGRWLEKVQHELTDERKSISATDLRDAIGEYLTRLADALRRGESIESEGTAAWSEVAREHALTRVRLGFDIEQLVREFILLRRVLFDVAREEKVLVNDLQGDRLADLIDAAIAKAVKSYIESRDLSARRSEAEHIGFLTHELRNPLSTAIMATTRLRKKPEVATAEGNTLDMLERALHRIRSLIDGTLMTQRLEAREMECRPVDITLGTIMTDATRAAELEAAQKGIAFNVRYDAEAQIYVDPGLTISAVQNVVDNAVKFTDRGRVDVVAEDRTSDVIIHVYDNCDGLSDQELKTIFEPFKRAHPGKAGTGLGLAIARQAVEAQGGQIGAESGGERGCHFWLTLPKLPH